VNSNELIRKMQAAGWKLDRIRGSHHIYKHPERSGSIPVPHPKKDLPKGTAQKILQQAGLK